ncbi:hypothetical protein LOC71_22910 [Rhodopirellula sp. JC740]|uniref:Coagulation factor 5/8 type domain protein n=1 Tax=Rhodopirellula halodulae TaxID=2894198 RepID=A0ABS8NNN3_9BACT|nr:hypothetical protein [Rhodopirellula sp. JC740]MCC9645140.1 hypothetical protein [Rhodopirellula sp. JC740]
MASGMRGVEIVHRSYVAFILVLFVAVVNMSRSSIGSEPSDFFAIRVVDQETGRGVPLVELRTTDENRYFTDSNGYVAFNEPGLMNRAIWFEVHSWGYESPRGPFDLPGLTLQTTPGTEQSIRIRRINVAERFYRQTGVGIYRDSMLLGKSVPPMAKNLNADIAGCDSVQTAFYRGKMRWFWQDTDQIGFGLGNYNMTGATSPSPQQINPDLGIEFQYFTREDSPFARPMVSIENAEQLPIWVDGLMVVKDSTGRERLVGRSVAARKDFSVARSCLLIYDDTAEQFRHLRDLPLPTESKRFPHEHPALVAEGEEQYFYIGCPPNIRVQASFEAVTDLGRYEGLTCLLPDGSVDRTAAGQVRFRWEAEADPVTQEEVRRLLAENQATGAEVPFALFDVESGRSIDCARGSIAWNPHWKVWTMLFCERGGDSFLGEVWFSTANSPAGPWLHCQKVATHARAGQDMNFYNPMQHAELMRGNGRFVYFEGTFVNTFAAASVPVPRYNYNQLMYRLDLDDPRWKLPEPPPH